MASGSVDPPFFGRGNDMDYLRDRISQPGITVLTGRPQIGKSRLLNELRKILRKENQYLVGYHRSSGTESAILYAAADLYEHAISDASWKSELKILYDNRKSGFPVRVCAALGEVLAEATPSVVKAAFQKAFNTLEAMDEILRTGGRRTLLQPLAIDEARTLLNLAEYAGKNRPLLLMLDQWEDGRDLEHEATILRTYIPERAQWPESLHFILHLRHPAKETTHYKAVQAWNHVKEFEESSASVDIHDLDPIDFESDQMAREELMTWLHESFPPFIQSIPDDDIISIINGNPGVLRRWLDKPPKNVTELKERAIDAHAYHYSEIENRLLQLKQTLNPDAGDRDPFKVALRLIFLSLLLNEQSWPIVEPSVLMDAPPSVLDSLEEKSSLGPGLIIERIGTVPSLGLPKRCETAVDIITTHSEIHPHAFRAFNSLVLHLVENIVFVEEQKDEKSGSILSTLVFLEHVADKLNATGFTRAFITATKILFGRKIFSEDIEKFLSNLKAATSNISASQARLLAMSLFNALNDAKKENDLPHRDALFDKLRALNREHPDDLAFRECLALGLFNMLVYAKEENDLPRRDTLLDELRVLYREHRDDSAVRENLAASLFNTLVYAKDENDLSRRDTLLDELWDLYHEHPDDSGVREYLASGLNNTLISARDENNLPRRDVLLDDLRALKREHPDDSEVRKSLSMGLLNSLSGAKDRNNLPRQDTLLDELRVLSREHPDDSAVRERLAMGLYNTRNDAKDENDLPRRDVLLDELWDLYRKRRDDSAVREPLARGLFNTLNDAKDENNLPRRDALLDELRALSRAHPDDAAIRAELAKGLFNTLNHAKDEDNLSRRDALLDELWALSRAHPDDPAVRESLAGGLFNTHNAAKDENDLPRHDALLDELRALSRAHPDEPALLALLILGLFQISSSVSQGDKETGKAVSQELYSMLRIAKEIAQHDPHPVLLNVLKECEGNEPEEPQ